MDSNTPSRPLRFHPDGSFKLLQVTDVQETTRMRPETLTLLNAVLDRARPDLVVLTGDQVKGYDPGYRHRPDAVRCTLTAICEPFVERQIPFAVTFGNHDPEVGVSNAQQEAWLAELPGCVNAWTRDATGVRGYGPGTLALPIFDASGHTPCLAVYLADSGAGNLLGGYEAFDQRTTSWLVQTARELATAAGRPVPGIVFQHLPVPEMYSCLRSARPGEGGVPGHRSHYRAGELLVPRADALQGGRLREPISCPDENTGEVDALVEEGSFFALYCGHNHKNTLICRYHGMDLGYAPTTGFGAYGPGLDRAARAFSFSADDPAAYTTQLLTYRELVGARTSRPITDWATERMPVTGEELRERARALIPHPVAGARNAADEPLSPHARLESR